MVIAGSRPPRPCERPPLFSAILVINDRLLGVTGMRQTVRWCVAGLVTVTVFGIVTCLAGVLLLPPVMKSGADRWVVAAGLGVAVGALAGLWGQWWATRESAAEPGATSAGDRTVSAGGDISGIASTGDDATNTQYR